MSPTRTPTRATGVLAAIGAALAALVVTAAPAAAATPLGTEVAPPRGQVLLVVPASYTASNSFRVDCRTVTAGASATADVAWLQNGAFVAVSNGRTLPLVSSWTRRAGTQLTFALTNLSYDRSITCTSYAL